MAQYPHLSNTDAELTAAIAAFPPRPAVEFDITMVRKRLDGFMPMLQKAREPFLPPSSQYRIEDHQILVEGGEIRIRVIIPTPEGAEGKTFPLFFWMHGGGFSIGSIEMDDYYLRPIAVALQTVITSVDYRLAPEYPFPTGVNDCFTALKWTAENTSKFFADLSKGFIVGGVSAGGNLATVMALRARDDPFFQQEGRQLTGQYLAMPAIVHPEAVPEKYKSELLSMEQNKDAPLLTRKDIYAFAKLTQAPFDSPFFSPLLAPSHRGLPPIYLQIAGFDPLRDEGLLYEKVLKEAGVKTKFDVYAGLPHVGNTAFPTLSVSKKFNKDFVDGLRWLLGGPQ